MTRLAVYLGTGALFAAGAARLLRSLVTAQPFGVPLGHRRVR
ncbi:hypothetical protein ACIGKR_08865 [Rhodococcus qingshengii]